MTINDSVFGELEYEYGWAKNNTVHFLGKKTEIDLMIDGEEDGNFDDEQYIAYQSLMQNWNELQLSLLQPILDYYHQKRYELGYNIEFNEEYSLIETKEQLLENITLSGIVVPYADINEGRDIRLIFDCTWDEENGLGVRLINEKVTEVGYQDVAI